MVSKKELRKQLESRDIELVSGKIVPATGFSKQLKKTELQELLKVSIKRVKDNGK